MQKTWLPTIVLFAGACISAYGQIKQTSIPIGNAVDKALKKVSLTGKGARPFHIRVIISEPENLQSSYQGSIEEWWVSKNQWRREVTAKGGMKQTIVFVEGKKTERDEGDYFPLWLRDYEMALFDPIPDAAAWNARGITIDQTIMPNGAKSDACARAKSRIGTGNRATDAFSNVCFDDEERLKFIGSPRYGMAFRDYRGFEKKQIAQKFVHNPEPGTTLVGEVTLLESGKKWRQTDLFTSLATNEDRFRTISVSAEELEQLTANNLPVAWPPVHSGNIRGRLAMYISIDATGQVREAWPLKSGEIPRLCRGGSSSLTFTGVHPRNSKGEPTKAHAKEKLDGPIGESKPLCMGVQIPRGIYPEVPPQGAV